MAQQDLTFQLQDDGELLVPMRNSRPKPIKEWADGKRTDIQARDEQGVPLWEMSFAVDVVNWGEADARTVKVRYSSPDGSFPSRRPSRPTGETK